MSGIKYIPGPAVVLLLALLSPGCGTNGPPGRAGASPVEQSDTFSQTMNAYALEADDVPQLVMHQRSRWVETALSWVEDILLRHRPGTGNEELRRLALTTLDDPLHLHDAPDMSEIGAFFRRMVSRALIEMETQSVESGAKIWKLYNHGFVIRTQSHTWGFDIFRGVGQVRMSDYQLDSLAGLLDACFVSHLHGDHADSSFVRRMVEAGKPVAVPGGLWSDLPFAGSLVRLGGGENRELAGLDVRVFPGHQGRDITNNVYLVTVDGLGFMHTGDQSNGDDFALWIDGLGERHRVDVLLANCWTTNLPRLVREVDPAVLITGHENELGHTVDHRESFAKTYRHLEPVQHSFSLMSWGEGLFFDAP